MRTAHVDGSHAFLNGAPTYLWLETRQGEPAEVKVEAPGGWRVVTALRREGEGFLAADLDELIDSPIHAAPSPVYGFEAAGVPHELVVWGRPEPGVAGIDELLADTRKIVEAQAAVFGGLPIDRYAFMLMLAPGAYGRLCLLYTSPSPRD